LLLEARNVVPAGAVPVVLGYGLNVAQEESDFPPGLRATSVRLETGDAPPREELLARFLARLETWIDRLRNGDSAALESAYRGFNRLLGRRVTVGDRGTPIRGTVEDLSPRDGLSLRLVTGERLAFAAEHVTLLETETFSD